jgi:hypothetical protein
VNRLSPHGRLILTALLLGPLRLSCSWAAPAEIKVFSDEIAEAQGSSLEMITSIFRPPSDSALRGNVFQEYGEYAVGVANGFELSGYAPVSAVDGGWRGEGAGVMLTFIAAHDEKAGPYWGFNVDLGYLGSPGETRHWSLDARPILGLRVSDWHFTVNPVIEIPLTGANSRAMFNPRAKAAFSLNESNAVGVEYYGEAGPLRHLLPNDRRNEVACLVWDGELGKVGINVGAGTHLTQASDRWVFKLGVSLHLQ